MHNLELGTYEGHVIKVHDGMLNLANMWRACGSHKNDQPFEWLRQDGSMDLIETLVKKESNTGLNPVMTRKGRYGGTFAHPVIGLAYAKYLSPEFHIWCNEWLLKSGLIGVSEGELVVKLGRLLTR